MWMRRVLGRHPIQWRVRRLERCLRFTEPVASPDTRRPVVGGALPFMSVRKAAALAIAQLGVAAFFIAGVARRALGDSAGWFVLAATVLAAFARAVDIESWAL